MDVFRFTTVVSRDHLYKFLALNSSLIENATDYTLYVLCADDEVYDVLSAIPFKNMVLVRLGDIEDDELRKARADRLFHAYCWTLKPVFLRHVLQNHPDAVYFAHLDADLFFFENPAALFAENPDASIYLTHHRNAKEFEAFYAITGIYNTGFVGCRRDETGLAAIDEWARKCIAYCPIKEEPQRRLFGDQRYVEDWPEKYKGVHVLESIGANAALWNISNYRVTRSGGQVLLDGVPLIFYHFSGLSIISRFEFNLCWYYHINDEKVVSLIYHPYLERLSAAIGGVQENFPWFKWGFSDRDMVPNTHFYVLDSAPNDTV
jgi:Nucleotide-diphospho-sugar transferase.